MQANTAVKFLILSQHVNLSIEKVCQAYPNPLTWYSKSIINDLGSYDDYVAFTQTDLSNVMQDRYGVIVMRCEQTHRVSSMPKPKPRPQPDFDS